MAMGEREQKEFGLKLQSTPKLREFVERVAAVATLSSNTREAITKLQLDQEGSDAAAVPFSLLRDLYADLGTEQKTLLPPLHRLLLGSSFIFDSPKPREKSEELKTRLRKLQDMSDKKEYEKLVHDITKHTKVPEYFSSYKEQLGFGIHVAVTMFTGFAFGYTVFRSQFRDTPVLHAAGGALGLIVGMLVETLLFVVRDVQREKMDNILKREKESASQATTSRRQR